MRGERRPLMYFLGIDLSLTSTGICVIDDEFNEIAITFSELIKPKCKGVARLVYIRTELEGLLKKVKPELVALEAYSFGSRAGQAFSIGELGGVAKVLLYELQVETILIPPTCLKKFITGKGNAPKDVMLMKTLSKYKREFTDNNLCDAFGLAMMGHAYLYGTGIVYEREALKKISVLC
jgi:crossover junction endodeoxyribonuclease RuvC